MKYTYTAVFTEKDGKVYARVPDLNGCITTGKNLSDAIEQMADAMAAWLCAAEDEGLPIPEPTQQAKISCGNDEELSLINADTLKYRPAIKKSAFLSRASSASHKNKKAHTRRCAPFFRLGGS